MARIKTIDYQPIETLTWSGDRAKDVLKEVEGKLFKIAVPPERVGYVDIESAEKSAIEYVQYMLRYEFMGVDTKGKSFSFPDNWDWSWVNKQGKFIGRLKKYLHKLYDIPESLLDKSIEMSRLGEQLAEYRYPEELLVDFTTDFDWRPGDFSDNGSCFWGDRSSAREVMANNGLFAFRVWTREDCSEEGKYKARSFKRAWLCPDFPKDRCFTIFNFYGNGKEMTVKVLADWLGLRTNIHRLYNHGSDCDLIYINNGEGTVFYPDEPQFYYLNKESEYDRLDLDMELDDSRWDSYDDDYDDDDDDGYNEDYP